MPLWVSTYFGAYLTFCLWSHVDDFKNKRYPWWFSIIEAAGTACLLIAALSFWLPLLITVPESMLLGLFVVGCVVSLGQATVACRRQVSDPELSSRGKLFVGISGSAIGIIITAPLLLWGFKSTVLGS